MTALRAGGEMGEGVRILIVDDDGGMSRTLCLIFEKQGYETETAGTGQDAVERARDTVFDVALVDVNLPDMEGMELLAPLKAMHTDIEVLMITGHASLESAVRALNAGASAYITKPLSMDEVLESVREVLEKQRRGREDRSRYEEAQRELVDRGRTEEELESRVRQRTFELQVLYELSQKIGYTLDYEELFRLMLDHLHRAVPYDVAAGLLARNGTGELFLKPARPFSEEVRTEIEARLAGSFARMSGRDVHMERSSTYILRSDAPTVVSAPLTLLGSVFQVPLIAGPGDEVVGLLFVGAEEEGVFSEDQVRLLYTVANQASVSIQRVRALLAAEQERLEVLVEHLPEGVLLLDQALRIMLANPVAREYLSVLTDAGLGDLLTELGARPLREFLGPPAEGMYHEVMMSGSPSRVFEVESRPMASGALVGGWVLVVRDVTEGRKLQDRVQQQDRLAAAGQLAAGIAHEINTPTQYVGDNTRFLKESFGELSGLLAQYGQLLEASKAGAVSSEVVAEVKDAVEEVDVDYLMEEIPEAIEQSLEGIGRVSEIVQAMREFSHPGGEEKSAIDLNRAIESTITVARNEWKYVADMETDLDDALPLVWCLPGELNQVILNLLLNATHAIGDVVGDGSGGKGLIRVSTRVDGEWVEIRIGDSGTGISEDARDRVFDPFFTTKEVGKGTGQGLAIAHNVVVEKHGGMVSFETEMGRGTTFILKLPARDVSRKKDES